MRTPSSKSLIDALDLSGEREKDVGVEIVGRRSGSGEIELKALSDLDGDFGERGRLRSFRR